MNKNNQSSSVIGWREWGKLPELGIPAIKMKVDTGAKTSALHAFEIERFRRQQTDFLRFAIHPLQRNRVLSIVCEAPLLDERSVTDSGGHTESRYVIRSLLEISDMTMPIEMTLTDRDNMRFRMLLGRSALQQARLVVDPTISYHYGQPRINEIFKKSQ